jgi:hypothetical protein
LGILEAFDPYAIGLSADDNSLKFGPDGKVRALKSLVVIDAETKDGPVSVKPLTKPHPMRDTGKIHIPLSLSFEGELLYVDRDDPGEEPRVFEIAGARVRPYIAHRITEVKI